MSDGPDEGSDTNSGAMESESTRKKQTCTCDICGTKLSRPAHLERHRKLHSTIPGNECFTCEHCGKRFTRKDVYQRHERSVHGPEQAARRSARKKSCRRCIRYKLRCSRELPCEACRQRPAHCVYDTSCPPAPCSDARRQSEKQDQIKGPPSASLNDLAHVAGILDRDDRSAPDMATSKMGSDGPLWLNDMGCPILSPTSQDAEPMQMGQLGGRPLEEHSHVVHPGSYGDTSMGSVGGTFLSPSDHPEFAQPMEERDGGIWGNIPTQRYVEAETDQIDLNGYSVDAQGTSPLAIFQDWDILRASRMDWLGCETEPSVSFGTGCSPEVHTSQAENGDNRHAAKHSGDAANGSQATSDRGESSAGSQKEDTRSASIDSRQVGHNKDTSWPGVLDRGGNETWPFDYTSNKGFRKITLPPLKQVLEQTVGDRPVIQRNTLMDLIKVLSAPQIPSLNDTPALEAMPAVAFLNEFIKIYFAEFHAVYPVLHIPTWRIEKSPTALLAAMACIGATYSTAEGSGEVSALLAEITQRALFWMGQQDTTSFRNSAYITASCFHQIYALGTGNRRLYEIADASRGLLVTSLRGLGILSSDSDPTADILPADLNALKQLSPDALEELWLDWRDREMVKRMAWSVFEFDCTLSTMTAKRGAFQMAELPARLPCSESIWDAHSAQAWAAILPFSQSAPAGIPFYSFLRDVTNSRGIPNCTPSWAKRLCAHAIGRTLHDLRETEDACAPNLLGLSHLASAQEETKEGLLMSFESLQESLARPSCTMDIVNMNIGCLSLHHSYLSSRGHRAMDLVVFIFRHSGQESSQALVASAKEHLSQLFLRGPVATRRLVSHAAAIVSIARDCTINTPCETMRVFMGYAFLLAFTKIFPFSNSNGWHAGEAEDCRQSSVKLDEIPWTRSVAAATAVEKWIECGGPASFASVPNICDLQSFPALKEVALNGLKKLAVWGLARKFYQTLCKFN